MSNIRIFNNTYEFTFTHTTFAQSINDSPPLSVYCARGSPFVSALLSSFLYKAGAPHHLNKTYVLVRSKKKKKNSISHPPTHPSIHPSFLPRYLLIYSYAPPLPPLSPKPKKKKKKVPPRKKNLHQKFQPRSKDRKNERKKERKNRLNFAFFACIYLCVACVFMYA